MATVTSAPMQVAGAFIDAFNRRDFSAWAALLGDDFQAGYPGADGLTAAQARAYNESFLPAFPDLHFEPRRVVAQGDTVVIEWYAGGTHEGPLTGPNGQTLPATGRRGGVHGVLLSEIRDGKIARETTYWNMLELLSQLGLA